MKRSACGTSLLLLLLAACADEPTASTRPSAAITAQFSNPPPPPVFGAVRGLFTRTFPADGGVAIGTRVLKAPVISLNSSLAYPIVSRALYSRGPAPTRIYIEFGQNGILEYVNGVTHAFGVITVIDPVTHNRWSTDMGQFNGMTTSPFVACPGQRTDYCLELPEPMFGTVEIWQNGQYLAPKPASGGLTFTK